MTKTGSGNLVLSGSDSYSGGTLVNAGTLQIGSGGTAGSLAGNITNNAALVFNRSDSPTFGGAISGSGGLTQAGTGILTLAGSNTYSGGTTISAGAISLNNANAVQNSTVTVGTNNGLLFNTNSGAIATFNVGGLAGSGNISLADGSHALTLSAGGNGAGTTYSGGLSGAGGLTKTGSGILDPLRQQHLHGQHDHRRRRTHARFQPAGRADGQHHQQRDQCLLLGLGRRHAGNPRKCQHDQQPTVQRPGGQSGLFGHRADDAGTSNPLLLSLGGISRSPGGTVDFTLPGGTQSATNGITTTTPNTSAGILGGYATVGGTDWACSDRHGGQHHGLHAPTPAAILAR